ncbi:hypothetical protein Tco_0721100 [Tanacetum coccineum]
MRLASCSSIETKQESPSVLPVKHEAPKGRAGGRLPEPPKQAQGSSTSTPEAAREEGRPYRVSRAEVIGRLRHQETSMGTADNA